MIAAKQALSLLLYERYSMHLADVSIFSMLLGVALSYVNG
jgi:hypothetical protein